MAEIETLVSLFEVDRTGTLYRDEMILLFFIVPELEMGKGL